MADATITAEDFYAANTITICVGSEEGGGYSAYAAVLARHLPKHIPGNPKIELDHSFEGNGGLKAANAVSTELPRDGTVIGAIRAANMVEPILNPGPTVKFDARTIKCIGNVSRQNGMNITWHTSDIKTIADARTREVRVGAGSPDSNCGTVANVLNGLLGTKFKTIHGYTPQTLHKALEDGEVEGVCGLGYNTILAVHRDWIEDHKLNYLAHTALERDAMYPDVPCTIEFAETEENQQVIRMMDYRQVMGRPYVTASEVPADRLDALRHGFNETMKDPDFVEEATAQGMIVHPLSGAQMETIIADAYAMPKAVIERTWELLGVRP